MAAINLPIKVYPDPLFKKLIDVCRKDRSLTARVNQLVEEKKLIVTTPCRDKLTTISWHLTDAALEIIYDGMGC